MRNLTKISFGVFCASAVLSAPLAAVAGHASPEIQIKYAPKLEREFTNNYGIREKEFIEEALRREIASRINDNVSRIEIEVLEASPNHPTFKQMGDTIGLSYQSISLGGASFNGKAYDDSGNLVHQASYKYETQNIRDSVHAWTWSDADNAARSFVIRLANSQ